MTELTLKQIIWQVVAAIPAGRVSTYGQVAKMAGFPGHARYVGAVLRDLPATSTLPWHRVVNAKGRLSFATTDSAYCLQKTRLQAEGVAIENGKLHLADYQLGCERPPRSVTSLPEVYCDRSR